MEYINDIAPGKGGLKYYKYWIEETALTLTSKQAVLEAIKFKFKVLRKDKINNSIEVYDYNTKKFKKIDYIVEQEGVKKPKRKRSRVTRWKW